MSRAAFTLLLLILLPLAGWGSDVPDVADFFPGLDEDSMRVRLAEADVQPMEGIWYFPDEDMTLGIERCPAVGHDERYRIIMLGSSDVHLLPGTVIGFLQASAVPTKWQLWLYSERDRITLCRPMKTVATTDASCTHITFDRPHWRVRVRVNVARFLPSLFRGVTISPEKVEEELPVGFRKVYPDASDGQPFNRIRYL